MEPIIGVQAEHSSSVARSSVRVVNGILMTPGATRNSSWFPRSINAPYPRFASAIPMPADKATAYDESNQEVLASNKYSAPIFLSKTSTAALPNLKEGLKNHTTLHNLDKIKNEQSQSRSEVQDKKDIAIQDAIQAKKTENTLLKYTVQLRDQIVAGHNDIANIDGRLAFVMDIIIKKFTSGSLTNIDIEQLYNDIENAVFNETDESHNTEYSIGEKALNREKLKEKIMQFLLACIALGKHFSTYSPYGALFLSMIERHYKQVLADEAVFDDYVNVEDTEFDAGDIIINKLPPETMLKYHFFPRHLFERYKQLLSEQMNLRHTSNYPDKIQQDMASRYENEYGLQEIKLIQAIHQGKLEKFKKAIILIWFSGGKKVDNMPAGYLQSLKNQLSEFKQHKYHVKIIVLIDYKVFTANTKRFNELVEKYSTIMELEFVEDLSFQQDGMQKLHKQFLLQATAINPKIANYFYQTAINLEQRLSTSLEYSIFIPFEQLERLISENFFDQLKRVLPFRYRVTNKIINMVKVVFLGKQNMPARGVRFFNLHSINVKKFIKDMQNLLEGRKL
jgi:hypothetical protein